MAFAAVPMTWGEGTLGCSVAVASSTRTWAPLSPWSSPTLLPLPPLLPLLPLVAVVVVQIEAADTGWNPVALGTLEVPGIAVALACWRLHPPATERRCRTSAAEW